MENRFEMVINSTYILEWSRKGITVAIVKQHIKKKNLYSQNSQENHDFPSLEQAITW